MVGADTSGLEVGADPALPITSFQFTNIFYLIRACMFSSFTTWNNLLMIRYIASRTLRPQIA